MEKQKVALVEFTEGEAQLLLQLLEIAIKANGWAAATQAVHFNKKLFSAFNPVAKEKGEPHLKEVKNGE